MLEMYVTKRMLVEFTTNRDFLAALTRQAQSNSVGHDPSQMFFFKLIPFLVAMRDLYMKTGQGFLLVFSITSASSLEELGNLRDEIIRIKDDENVPMVIVGNKADLEENRAVPRAKGFSVSQRWGSPYYETSARSRSMSSHDSPCFQMLFRIVLTNLKLMLMRSLLTYAAKCSEKKMKPCKVMVIPENMRGLVLITAAAVANE